MYLEATRKPRFVGLRGDFSRSFDDEWVVMPTNMLFSQFIGCERKAGQRQNEEKKKVVPDWQD